MDDTTVSYHQIYEQLFALCLATNAEFEEQLAKKDYVCFYEQSAVSMGQC